MLAAALQSGGATAEASRERELARQLSSTFAEWLKKAAAGEPIPRGLERLKTTPEVSTMLRVDSAITTTGQREQKELAAFHLDRSRRLYDQGNNTEAITELRRAVFLSPYEAQAHLLIGRIHLRAGRPKDAIDAIIVKVRDGQVTNQPFYVAIGVTVDGKRDILGIWAGGGTGEGAKWWHQVLTEIKNRGVEDACIVVCDGLKGLPEAIDATWPLALVQTCVLHLIRNTFRLASRRHWDAMARDLRPVYTAPSEQAAKERLAEFNEVWGEQYPAVTRLWENSWSEFAPFLDYAPEIRRVIYSTNAVESLHARMRRATRARGHFPNEQAALKCLSLAVRSLDPTGSGRRT